MKTLVIYGPPLTGKTTWAQSLGNHIYMRARYNAREASLCESKDYCVIDDISGGIRFFPHWKDWFGGQPYVQIRLLYRDEVLLRSGKPTIWLNNRDPREQLRDMVGRDYSDEQYQNDCEWMDANCIFVYVDSPIVTFHANTE